MPRSRHKDAAFRYRHFGQDVIVLCVRWHYLYRAVDKQGRIVDFLLRKDRGIEAAQAFFRKALESNGGRPPRKVTLDGHVPSHRSLRLLRREDKRLRQVFVRRCKYLNNIVEQDHRTIKRRIASMNGIQEFRLGRGDTCWY